MYLDHLRNNTVTAAAAAEPSVSFMDCMEAALYCTEVCSAADPYLIKAEAEYMAKATEDGDGAVKEGWWNKIKKVFQKILDALQGFYKKIAAFIKDRVIPYVVKKAKEIAVKFQKIGMKSKIEKCKDPDKSKLENVSYMEGRTCEGQIEDVIKDINDRLEKNDLSSVDVKELMGKLPSREKNDCMKKIADANYETVKGMADSILNGNTAKEVLKKIDELAKNSAAKVATRIKEAKGKIAAAEKAKDEARAQEAINDLKSVRAFGTAVTVIMNHAGNVAVSIILSQAVAVNKWCAACSTKKEEKK